MAKCFKSVRILKNTKSNKFFAKAVTCNSLQCDYCREQIKATLTTKILYAVNKHDMDQFFTLTTSKGYDELVQDFAVVRKKMHSMKKSNFVKKARGKTLAEKEKKYTDKVHEMVEYEIRMMFYVAYVTEAAICIARQEKVHYISLRNKEKFIQEHYKAIVSCVSEYIKQFKNGKTEFTPLIKGEPRLFRNYEELYKYCHNKITKNEDQDFYYIRILEVAGKCHFHILCNRYINHYLMSEMFCHKNKKDHRKIEPAKKIYMNIDLQEYTDFTTEIQAQKAVTKYITMYITKDLSENVEKFKKIYPGKKRIDIIKSSRCIDVALNAKFREDQDEEQEKYVYVKTRTGKRPRAAWEEIVGSKDYVGNNEYINSLQDVGKYKENPYSVMIKKSYKDYQKNLFLLGKDYKAKKENAKIADRSKLSEKYKNANYELQNAFQEEKNRLETACLKNALVCKLEKKSTEVYVSPVYLKKLKKDLIARSDFPKQERFEYLQTQKQFINDLANPNKKIIFLLGAAGSGKTQTLANVYRHFRNDNHKTEFCAFTARAANVLAEKGLPAKTIHRLCKARYSEVTHFLADEENQLDVDVLFIDEISMLSKFDFALLLNALPPEIKIICCGDQNQINPVGSNNIIFELELLDHPAISYHYLNLNFRSTEKVTTIANQVLQNDFSNMKFKPYNIQEIHEKIKDGWKILTNSANMAEQINKYESRFHTDITETSFFSYSYGQEIMILRNDPKNEVYNGNICKIKGISENGKVVIEKLNSKTFEYSLVKSANYFQPAFATTIHKAQGSEYSKVAIIFENKSKLLNNNLLYTAITRAKEKFEVYICEDVNIETFRQKQENGDKYNLTNANLTFQEGFRYIISEKRKGRR